MNDEVEKKREREEELLHSTAAYRHSLLSFIIINVIKAHCFYNHNINSNLYFGVMFHLRENSIQFVLALASMRPNIAPIWCNNEIF